MNLQDTRCCAIREIDGLSDHRTPEEAMECFCEEVDESDYGDDGHYDAHDNWVEDKPSTSLALPGLITFSGVTKWEKGMMKEYGGMRGDVTYGPKFAAFILKEKLGAITASPLTTNRLNHPGRQIRAWMWKPNQKALNAWWKKRKEGKG